MIKEGDRVKEGLLSSEYNNFIIDIKNKIRNSKYEAMKAYVKKKIERW